MSKKTENPMARMFVKRTNKDIYYAIGDGNYLFGKVTDELKKIAEERGLKYIEIVESKF